MKNNNNEEWIEIEDVPVTVAVTRLKPNRYGSVEGLDDGELANPADLEQQVYIDMYGPIMSLPVKQRESAIRPTVTEDRQLDWGAFGTIDWDRMYPYDKVKWARDKIDERRQELADEMIMISIIKDRLPRKAMYRVIKHLKLGVIELEHITDLDMYSLARRWLRCKRLKQDIERLLDYQSRAYQ